jgi:hypothetical protein
MIVSEVGFVVTSKARYQIDLIYLKDKFNVEFHHMLSTIHEMDTKRSFMDLM